MADDAEVHAGQAIYHPWVLRAYDAFVLGLSCTMIWRCPRSRIQRWYDDNVGARHLDVGVGSGYFLDHARWPVERPAVTLVDLNPNALRYTAHRIRRFDVTTQESNVLEPFEPPNGPVDSAAANFMLHCVPGDFTEKGIAFDHLKTCVRPGGRIFGSTLLTGGVPLTRMARFLTSLYNSRGIFHNDRDTLDGLRKALGQRFESYDLTVAGNLALFAATNP